MEASGIHAHPTLKLGLRPPAWRPALELSRYLTGTVPEHPVTCDHIGSNEFGLYGNDRFGVCGPTSVANLVRLITAGLLGQEIQPSQDDVFDLYRRSGNPDFDPATGADDNGVDMQVMLDALLAGGIGGVKPVAFAKLAVSRAPELTAATSIFGGTLWGTVLQTAQQAQTSSTPPRWDYHRSPLWGGHAVMNGAYEPRTLEDIITWGKRVETTAAFRRYQLQQAWVVIWPWNLDHPAFQAGVDLAALRADYTELTGRAF